MYALQALGIVIVYKTSRVFNFATGAIGLACAYLATLAAHAADRAGHCCSPSRSASSSAWPWRSPCGRSVAPLNRTVVTLGWLLGLQGVVGALYGTTAATAGRPGSSSATAARARATPVYSNQVAVMTITAALSPGSRLLPPHRARHGDPRGGRSTDAARLLGIRVDRVNLVAWGLGGGVSGLAGVLVTPLLEAWTPRRWWCSRCRRWPRRWSVGCRRCP